MTPSFEKFPWWRRVFQLDLRSLALCRIALGAVLFAELGARLFDARDLLTDDGLLPRVLHLQQFASAYKVSLPMISGLWSVQIALLLGQMALAVLVILGPGARWALLASSFLMTSLVARNFVTQHAGDDVFRLVLLWMCFLPCDRYFIWRGWRGLLSSAPVLATTAKLERASLPARDFTNSSAFCVSSVASLVLILQLVGIYTSTAILKWHPSWWSEGTAVAYALQLDAFTTSFGKWWLQFPDLLTFATRLVYVVEWVIPPLVLIPFWQRYLRTAVVLAMVGFHLSLVAMFALGAFPWVCCAFWLALLPSEVWPRLLRVRDGFRDALRGCAEKFTQFPGLDLSANRLDLTSLQVSSGEVAGSRGFYARARQGFLSVIVAALGATAFLSNLHESGWWRPDSPAWFQQFISFSGVHQRWGMFSPLPMRENGWFLIPARRRDGSVVDLMFRGEADFVARPLSLEHRENTVWDYPGTRWRKLFNNIILHSQSRYRGALASLFCRRMNAGLGEYDASRIEVLEIVLMYRRNYPLDQPKMQTKPWMLWRHHCDQKPADWSDAPESMLL